MNLPSSVPMKKALDDAIIVSGGNNIVLGDDGQIDYVLVERGATTGVQGADTDAADIDLIESLSTTSAGGVDNITANGGNDIILGGRHGDTINAGDGSNLVIGDSGRITAANTGVAQFADVPMTFGLIETIAFGDGGSDSISTGTGRSRWIARHTSSPSRPGSMRSSTTRSGPRSWQACTPAGPSAARWTVNPSLRSRVEIGRAHV